MDLYPVGAYYDNRIADTAYIKCHLIMETDLNGLNREDLYIYVRQTNSTKCVEYKESLLSYFNTHGSFYLLSPNSGNYIYVTNISGNNITYSTPGLDYVLISSWIGMSSRLENAIIMNTGYFSGTGELYYNAESGNYNISYLGAYGSSPNLLVIVTTVGLRAWRQPLSNNNLDNARMYCAFADSSDLTANVIHTLILYDSVECYQVEYYQYTPPVLTYTITVTESDRGTCTADKTEAAENETVRVTVKPNLGQKIYRLYVVGDTVGTVSVTTESENVYSFTMPADNVKVSAVFMSNDAYVPAGEDAEDLGGGDYSDISDPVPVPSVPSISASDAGMITLFRPTLAQLKSLNAYMWTNFGQIIENLIKWFTDPMSTFIALNIFPCIPDVSDSDREIRLGTHITDIRMFPILSQWYDFDCGTIDITPYTGTMLDYAPNTKIQIMLPFIGSSALDTDEVMNKTIGLKYRIDLLSGACVAMLTINDDVRYQWTGECATNIPLTGADYSRAMAAIIGAVGVGVTGFMAAGAAGIASQAAASAATTQAMNNNLVASKAFKDAIGDVVKGSRGAPAMREKLKQASMQTMEKALAEAGSSNRIAGSIRAAQIARTVNNVVGQVMSGKGTVTHSGAMSGTAAMLGVRTPYVIIEYPNQSLPENYRHFVGYPSNITARLGDLTGYTECEQLIANGITGTDSEYTELVEALKGGVYL